MPVQQAGQLSPLQNKTNLKSKLASLYAYLAKRLQIKQAPRLVLTNDPVNAAKPYGTTAYYNHNERLVKVFITERHPTDILRSFAHEIIHHWQNEHGKLGDQTDDHYAQNNPELRKREMEAYLLGNIIFRDWQDEQRYGPPSQPPQLMSLNENFIVTNPTRLKDIIKQMIRQLIAKQIIASHQDLPAKRGVNPSDYEDEIAANIAIELSKQLEVINGRDNAEYPPRGSMYR